MINVGLRLVVGELVDGKLDEYDSVEFENEVSFSDNVNDWLYHQGIGEECHYAELYLDVIEQSFLVASFKKISTKTKGKNNVRWIVTE